MIFKNKKQREKRTLKKYEEKGKKVIKIKKGNPKNKKETHIFSRATFYFLILVFFGTTGYLIFFSEFLDISEVDIQKGEIVSQESIQKIVDSKLEGKYLNFMKKNNLILLNGEGIKEKISANFKIIEKIQVKKKFPNGLKISFLERKPQLILVSGGKNWVIDENGVIFDETEGSFSYLEKNDFPVVFNESEKIFFLGDFVLDRKYISFISSFRQKTEDELEVGFENEIRIPSISSGELKMKTKEGWLIILDENLGANKEKEMLQAVLENKIEKEKRPSLEYIDLRVPNKVFYKFKDENPEEAAKETSNQAVPAKDSATKKNPKKKN